MSALEGQEIGVGDWFEITQDRVDAFADVTLDHQWIHVDRERAAEGPFGGTIAHGYLTLSLIPYLNSGITWPVEGARMTVNYGLDRVRFITPVPVGSKVRSRTKVVEVREVPGGVQVKGEVTIEIEGASKPACVAETLLRFYF